MLDLMLALMLWLETNTNYNIPDTPPVEFVSREDLQKLTGGEIETFLEAVAAFDLERKVIYLPEDFNYQNVLDQSRLLHEMVHWLQVVNNIPYRCKELCEPEAYTLQAKYLNERGVDASNHKYLSLFLGSCPGDFQY